MASASVKTSAVYTLYH